MTTFKRNFLVWISLMLLLTLTLVSAYIPLGGLNLILNLTISVAKALLVMIFFMHLVESSALVRLAAAGGFLWLGFLLALTLADSLTRTTLSLPTP